MTKSLEKKETELEARVSITLECLGISGRTLEKWEVEKELNRLKNLYFRLIEIRDTYLVEIEAKKRCGYCGVRFNKRYPTHPDC